jgi:hypothetical protein
MGLTRGVVTSTALAALVLAAPAKASWYFVDPGHPDASDTNPGTESLPWRHCPGMPGWSGSAALVAGDTVFFASSEVWEASGAAAVLQVTGGVAYDGHSWGSGERATLRATGELSRSVINLMDDHAVHPTVVRGFEVDAGSTVTTGIGVNWPHSSGSMDGATKRIEDAVVHSVASQSAAGEYEYGIVISSGYGGSRVTANVEVVGCVVYDISRGGINVYSANDDPSSRIEDVLVRGNEIHGIGLDPDYAGSALPLKNWVKNVVVEFNSVHDTVRGSGISISSHEVGFRGPENAIVRHNIVRRCETMGVLFHVRGSTEVDVYGNLILENTYQGVRFMTVMGTLAVRIYNNTFFRNVYPGWSHEILVGSNDGDIAVLEISNNIFRADAETVPIVDSDGDITGHTNNVLYRQGGGTLVTSAGISYTAADITSWEPTAVAADPQLVDELDLPEAFVGAYGLDMRPDTDGLAVEPASPCTDQGADLGLAYASSVNSVSRPYGAGWDVGAYEIGPDPIFADGFETGDAERWAASVE